MNYRHGFHAGNHADVLKHAICLMILNRLKAKAKPLVTIDLFGGAGRYDLILDERAARTLEWRDGVGRIWGAWAPQSLHLYQAALEVENKGELRWCPGSPRLLLGALRPQDKLLAVELHEEEAAGLEAALGGDNRARVYVGDGWRMLHAFLPPTPRRGMVLIDPPFEKPGEFDRMASAAKDGLRRWATGVFALWHPVKDLAAVSQYEARLKEAAGDAPLMMADLRICGPAEGKLLGSAMAVINPPYGLEEDLAEAGPWLARHLAQDEGAQWRMEWLTPRK